MEIIEKRLKKIIGAHRNSVGLLYSGGLDSSIIAKIMTILIPPSSIIVVSVGLRDSIDLNNAILGAEILGIDLNICFLTEERVLETTEILKQINIINHPVALSIAIPIFLGMQTLANKLNVKTVLLGQGADELFGGYQRYVQLYEKKGLDAIKKAMTGDLRALQEDQIIREQKMAQFFGLNLIYPFLDPKIIKRANSYPISNHISYTPQEKVIRKVLLRNLGKKLDLPEIIVERPKKAIQYGSGTIKLLKKIAKSNNYRNIADWFQAYFQQNNTSLNQIEKI
ncbi:MAG: asparagine synthase C-terminal domain-containing protein [Promethearchaeota archaeon]